MDFFRQTLRSLLRTPGFSLLTILTMALGIASATALFSVVDAVLLRPLAFPDSGRLVAINTVWAVQNRTTPRVSGGDFLDLRKATASFSSMAIYAGGELGVRLEKQAQFASTFQVDPHFFSVLDVTPALGRFPTQADARRTAVLSVPFAEANWGSGSSALGRTVFVDNNPYEVIGLIGAKHVFPEKAQVWITGPVDPENQNHTAFNYHAVARLRPGISFDRAQAELATISSHQSDKTKSYRIVPLAEQLTARVRTTLFFLFGGAGLLLLISCANVAHLMLARAASRTNEIAVRMALGSGSAGLVRLLAAEGLMLGAAAATAAFLLTGTLLRLIYPLIASAVPRAAGVLDLHAPVFLFAIVVSALTVLTGSLLPVLYLRKTELAEVLKRTGGRGAIGGGRRSRQAIVVAQIALCCMLCVSAALLSGSFLALTRAPLGYRTEGVLVMYAAAPAFQLPEYLRAIQTFELALDNFRRIPGVRHGSRSYGLASGPLWFQRHVFGGGYPHSAGAGSVQEGLGA